MSRVAVIFTGGTISMALDPEAGGNVPTLDGAAILARTPGLDEIADVVAIDWGRLAGAHLTIATLIELWETIRQAASDSAVDGVVVVQGTDTIEESAFCWDLLHDGPSPIVVTGAMRSSTEAGYDGPANLCAAVLAAASPGLHGQGVTVAMAGTVHAADDVSKRHATSLTAFRSPNLGPLGVVVGNQVVVGRRRAGRRHVAIPRAAGPIHLITSAAGIDGSLLDAAMRLGSRGIVVAAAGSGNTSAELLAAGERAMAAGIPLALVSRTGAGRAGTGYAFPGGGATWVRAGAMLAGSLNGPKARVALALGIGNDLDRQGLASLLADRVET